MAPGWLLLEGCGLVRVLFLEALHSSGRVNQLLLSCKKWMAARADFDADHIALKRGPRIESIPAGAVHLHRVIIGMNSFFHDRSSVPAGLREGFPHLLSRVARPATILSFYRTCSPNPMRLDESLRLLDSSCL